MAADTQTTSDWEDLSDLLLQSCDESWQPSFEHVFRQPCACQSLLCWLCLEGRLNAMSILAVHRRPGADVFLEAFCFFV